MLAPMTNTQSNDDGTLSDDEFHWLTMRAKGGFGLTMTCASHVQEMGKGFPGQLGCFDEKHFKGHARLASAIKRHGSLAVLQLHHAGMRSPKAIIGENPVCPSANEKHGAQAMARADVIQLREDFIKAAVRAKAAGYDGVEVHGAHGYILTQFLSSEINHRNDEYGGSLENRARIIFEIVSGIRANCGSGFLLGVRLSPERFGMELNEVKAVSQQLLDGGQIDFLDISLWDVFKIPEGDTPKSKSLMEHFTELNRGSVRLTVAGKIMTAHDVAKVLNSNVDFVTIGRAAIIHHNFPHLVMNNSDFSPVQTPVSEGYLKNEGLGEKMITYMKRWPKFVE